MKKITFEGVAYYSSCMMLFNLIYLIKLLNEGLFKDKFEVDFRSFSCLVDVNFITFRIVSLMILLSIIFTFFIVFRDDTIKNKNSIGKKVNITSLKDLTSENYFTNYSLLVLTGLSLPVLNEFYTLILYIFVVASLGIVYIKKI